MSKSYTVGLGIVFVVILSFFLKSGVFVPKEAFPKPKSERLRVVTTFFPIYDFTKNVGKDKIELDILFTQTPEVASFTPADIQKINNADIVIKNGAGLEPILDDLIKSSDNKNLIIVDTSEGVKILEFTEGIHFKKEEEEEHGHDHKLGDPHIWLNPRNAIIQVENIRNALAAHNPKNADFYKQNANDYIMQLQNLDQEIEIEVLRFKKKDFVAFHPAFIYFAKRYGLNQAAVFEEFPGKRPSPRYLSGVIKTIKELQITSLFAEPQFSPKVIKVIAHDLGLEIRILDPIETGDVEKDSYISIMRENLQTLKDVLQ